MKPYGPPRPLRSQGVPTLRGNILTDAKILSYMLKGFYGPERQAEAQAEYEDEAKRAKARAVKTLTAADILSTLL